MYNVQCIPSSISILTTQRHCLTLRGICTEFFWGDHYSVLFHLYARGRHCYAARATRQALSHISSYYYFLPSVHMIPEGVLKITGKKIRKQVRKINGCSHKQLLLLLLLFFLPRYSVPREKKKLCYAKKNVKLEWSLLLLLLHKTVVEQNSVKTLNQN